MNFMPKTILVALFAIVACNPSDAISQLVATTQSPPAVTTGQTQQMQLATPFALTYPRRSALPQSTQEIAGHVANAKTLDCRKHGLHLFRMQFPVFGNITKYEVLDDGMMRGPSPYISGVDPSTGPTVRIYITTANGENIVLDNLKLLKRSLKELDHVIKNGTRELSGPIFGMRYSLLYD